ncbi:MULTISPECIES: c-type cytochrome [Thiomicrorhabdus]|uniref:Cytochrome c n=1 Tax=Thiomicrorhabdus heinhorstiae TaxID=2748010 RepID=A0ABS0BWK5_9GAMM|nr:MULTISPECIES: cytochrome c [Thiomicrorhabdus]MBF6057359.1 cytochrome c [Thiomicrorhabdus heinhorstiae]MBF6057364.1 cytochrome c [Thiomicrorhabdus heinhorstiae]
MDLISLYPTWYEPTVGSGWVVALIATFHVLASHTSVGAALLFAYLSHKAYREDREDLLDFIKKYGLFLLVFTYVAGSITGPGIWYSTTVASPNGIGALIHSFVWKWATEWVFFVIEVVGVYMIVYLVGKVDKRTHMKISVIFGLASWATMLIIVGILSFMMLPGKEQWFADGGYLNGFYGTNTFIQLGMRTAFMFTITAVVGGIVIAGIKDPAFKKEMARKLGWLGIISTIVGALMFQWYLTAVPEQALLVMENRLPDYFMPSIVAVLAGTLAYFIITMIRPQTLVQGFAGAMAVIILVAGLWPEETARESMRKPWVAGQYVYSNQVIGRDVPGMDIKSQLPLLEKVGILKAHPFTPEHLREVNEGNKIQAGEFIAMTYCSNCHSPSETGIRPLHRYFPEGVSQERVAKYVKGVLTTGNIAYMPKMPMTDSEVDALAAYLVLNNNGGQAAVTAAIDSEIAQRDRALAEKNASDKVAALDFVQEVK